MTQDQFCDGIRAIGGGGRAAPLLDIDPRRLQRLMAGKEPLTDVMAERLHGIIHAHWQHCSRWLKAMGAADAA